MGTTACADIMIVEDDKIAALDISTMVKKLGHRVCATASSGEEALDSLKEIRPDLILMDIVLDGEIDGIEAVATILEVLDIPVIYITAHTDDATRERAEKTGASGFLSKPVDRAALEAAIQKAL